MSNSTLSLKTESDNCYATSRYTSWTAHFADHTARKGKLCADYSWAVFAISLIATEVLLAISYLAAFCRIPA